MPAKRRPLPPELWLVGGSPYLLTVMNHELPLTRRIQQRLIYFAALLEPVAWPCRYPQCFNPAAVRREWG